MAETESQKAALARLDQFDNALRLEREAESARHDALLQTARDRISVAESPEALGQALDSIMASMALRSW